MARAAPALGLYATLLVQLPQYPPLRLDSLVFFRVSMTSLTRLMSMMGLVPQLPQYADGEFRVPDGSPNMSSLASPVFGLDSVTGFLPPQLPLARLPSLFDQWEDALQLAMIVLKRPGDCEDPPASESEKVQSLAWRERIQHVCAICSSWIMV